MATPLPAAADFTGPSVTEGTFKTKLTDMRTFLADLLGTDGTEATALAALLAPFSAANPRTAAYALVAGDRGKVIYYTGTGGVTLTLPVTSTTDFGIGYMCAVVNQSTGVITVQRTSTDTVDGTTAISVAPGASVILFIAAAAKWVSVGKVGAASETASGTVEMATTAEAAAGTDTARAVTPAGLLEAKKLTYNDATVSTNGTTVKEITGIPSWARVIVLWWSNINSADTFSLRLDLGDAGGFETSATTNLYSSVGGNQSGSMLLVNVGGNTWTSLTPGGNNWTQTLSATLDRVRLVSLIATFVSGTLTVYWL